MSIGTWFTTEEKKILTLFSNEEAIVMQFLAPLGKQILAAAESLGKATLQEGVQVFLGAAQTAVTAGAEAAATGGNAVTTAEASFVSTMTSQGITVLHNAEAGAIKAAVAIAQSITPIAPAVTVPSTGV